MKRYHRETNNKMEGRIETENTIKVPAGLIKEDHGKFLIEE